MATGAAPREDAGVPHVCLIAGEQSGDNMGAALMTALIGKTGGRIRFSGIGGVEMSKSGGAYGFKSFFPMRELSVGGVFEVIPHIPRIIRRVGQTVHRIRKLAPDVVVTIDAPGFAFSVGKRLKGAGPSLVHYVAPSVWAWRGHRAKMIAGFLDHLLMIFPFEAPYFEKWGLPSTFVGHPAVEMARIPGDGPGFRRAHGIAPDQPLLCVLPGSRASEVKYLLPVFGEVLGRLKAEVPDLAVVTPTVAGVAKRVRAAAARWPVPAVVTEGTTDKRDAFAAADMALAASGTVTYELAAAGVPMVIAYRLVWLSAALIRRRMKIERASVVNLVLGRVVAPEFIQENCRAELIAPAVAMLLRDSEARLAQMEGLAEVAKALGEGDAPASERAAGVVSDILKKRRAAAQ